MYCCFTPRDKPRVYCNPDQDDYRKLFSWRIMGLFDLLNPHDLTLLVVNLYNLYLPDQRTTGFRKADLATEPGLLIHSSGQSSDSISETKIIMSQDQLLGRNESWLEGLIDPKEGLIEQKGKHQKLAQPALNRCWTWYALS